MQVHQTLTTLASKDIDGILMYPGKWVLTWIKLKHMPWQLASIEPYVEEEE